MLHNRERKSKAETKKPGPKNITKTKRKAALLASLLVKIANCCRLIGLFADERRHVEIIGARMNHRAG